MIGSRLLIVDDEVQVLRSIVRSLRPVGYECTAVESVAEAREKLANQDFDLVVCDIRMPGQSGLVLVKEVQDDPAQIPVLMITGVDDPEIAHMAAVMGTNGYLMKPFSVNELRINVDQALELGLRSTASASLERKQERRIRDVRGAITELEKRARANDQQAADLLLTLSEAVGRRDLETGGHIRRIGEASAMLAEAIGMSPEEVEAIRLTAPMHDVGKVAVPDSILLKHGRLNEGERALMERHAEVGHGILSGSSSPLLELAAEIALSHHEKFDGSGYPSGIAGEEIPVSGRIVAITDVFDALTSDRPYRAAMPVDKALKVMAEGRGTHFDPRLFDLFIARLDEVELLAGRFTDIPDAGPPQFPEIDDRPVDPADVHPDPDYNQTDATRAYLDAMIASDAAAARRIAIGCLQEGMTLETLYGDVLAPALWRIGALWENSSITPADEGIATAITERVMASAFEYSVPAEARGAVVLLAAVSGQRHSLGLRMVADILELAGFRIVFLGSNIPADVLVGSIESRQPDLIGLSFTIGTPANSPGAIVAELSNTFPDVPLILGGQAIGAGYTHSGQVAVSNDLHTVFRVADDMIEVARSL